MADDKPGGLKVPEGVKTKVFGLPLWMIVVAGAGTLALVLYLRNQSGGGSTSTTSTSGVVGDTSGAPPGIDTSATGTLTDPLTIADLQSAMAGLSSQIAAASKPAINVAVSIPKLSPQVVNNISVSTSRTTGGSSTASLSVGAKGFQPTPLPRVISAGQRSGPRMLD